MAEIHPFQAVVPQPQNAARVASPPYDVVSRDEARALAVANPLSFLRVLRAEIDLPPEVDPDDERVYEQARSTYRDLRRRQILVREPTPRLYVYSLQAGAHRQTGLAALCSVDDYRNNLIRKHEKTRPDKEDDRTRHILALRAQTGLVFLTCPDRDDWSCHMAATTATPPLFDFTADDGVRHSLWRVEPSLEPEFRRIFAEMPALYIADGHHRAAAASRVCESLRAERPRLGPGASSSSRFPAVIFPAGQLRILPYNRVVRGLNGHAPDELLTALGNKFEVQSVEPPGPERPGDIHLYLRGVWRCLTLRGNAAAPAESAVAALDVSRLQDHVLRPLLGIDDPRTDRRIDFIGGIRGAGELERLVDGGAADLAFCMYPPTVQQLMEISDSGLEMPPKSTWFEPKLRDGLLVHEFSQAKGQCKCEH